MDIFFEIHKDLPREGPGDNPSTRKALSLLTDLPLQPLILDIGCGPGMQTIELAKRTNGTIIAIDTHQLVLPPSAWWKDYYTPQEARIAMLHDKYRDDVEAIQLLDESQKEIDLYRQYSDWYGYVFYIMQVV